MVRSDYIEKELLTPWCNIHSQSQIVVLGSGLDTRPYKFKPFQINQHTVFEIDFPIVIGYKEKLMLKEKPLCNIVRISVDLIEPDWSNHLLKNGFSEEIPTFWLLEGLVYYLDGETVSSLLTKTADISKKGSQIFIDVINTSTRVNSKETFSKHQNWDLTKDNLPIFFATTGWEVIASFADEYDQVRDIGKKKMIFVQGIKN